MSDHEVISAFLDNEPVDPLQLGEALADPAGRELLIDLLALRKIAQARDPMDSAALNPPFVKHRAPRLIAAAAVLGMVAFGGYRIGREAVAVDTAPPAPTITIAAGESWQEISNGGGQ